MYESKRVYVNMTPQTEGFRLAGQVHANGLGKQSTRSAYSSILEQNKTFIGTCVVDLYRKLFTKGPGVLCGLLMWTVVAEKVSL